MTAPLGEARDPYDPEAIVHIPPERERKRILKEYRKAAKAAARDVRRYTELTALLHRWSSIAAAAGVPGFPEVGATAGTGDGEEYLTLHEVIARRRNPS